MNRRYLDALDRKLAAGAASFSADFRRRRARYVLARQRPDGGFAGRLGESDIYYTDFALRVLTLLDPDPAAFRAAAQFLSRIAVPPADAAECFNRLHTARLLRNSGNPVELDAGPIAAKLTETAPTPYNAFLVALCCELLDAPFPNLDAARSALAAARCPDGGYNELPGESAAQTSSTAAAVSFLRVVGELDGSDADRNLGFLTRMQAPSGGFLAHRDAPEPDLLSTFSALTVLSDLDALDRIDLPAVGRFVRALAANDGGFRASPADRETDIEYTYYGIASAALLRHHLDHAPAP